MEYKTPKSKGIQTDRYVHYTGSSMYPTFQEPEFLIIEKPAFGTIYPGDIIVFKTSKYDRLVIHRVVKIQGDLFWTKGDNNRRIDRLPIHFDSIYGRAVGTLKNQIIRRVFNGRAGLIWAHLLKSRILLVHYLIRPVLVNSLTLKIKKLLVKLISIEPDLAYFKTAGSAGKIRFIWKNKLIGSFCLEKNVISLKRIYRIAVDRRKLMKNIQTLIKESEELA